MIRSSILGNWAKTRIGMEVERSSTIPLNRLLSVANISVSRHGELNSRAQCPLPRNTFPFENSVLNRATTKSGGISHLLTSDKVLTSTLPQWTSGTDYNSSLQLDDTADTSMFTGNQPASMSMATNVWEENFQDLSSFCQDSKLSDLTNDMSTGRENLSVPLDDDLNTPEIGYEEFNFDSWSKAEPIEDNYLWDENPLEKIGNDHYGEGNMFHDNQSWDDLPDETSMSCVNIRYASEETTFHEKQSLISDINASNDTKKNSLENKENTDQFSDLVAEKNDNLEFYTPQTTEVSNGSTIGEMTVTKDTSDFPSSNLPRTKFSLPLATFESADVLNTPDVLEKLDSQPEFDLVRFVLEDTSGSSNTNVNADSQPCTEVLPVKEEEVEVETSAVEVETSAPENSILCDISEQCISDKETVSPDKKSLSEPHLVVYPSDQSTSKVCIIIKRDVDAEMELLPIESHKRSLSNSRKENRKRTFTNDDDDSDSNSSDDEEYTPPAKSKRNNPSCTKRRKSECSRYRELRNRNNEASRKSRLNRKAREEEMKVQAADLELENQKLKIRAEELEKLVDVLRKALLTAMVKGKE